MRITFCVYVWPQEVNLWLTQDACHTTNVWCIPTATTLSLPAQRPPAVGNQDVVDDFLKRKQQAAAYRARALGQDLPSAPHSQWPQPVRAGAKPVGQAAPGPAAQPAPDRRNKAEKVKVVFGIHRCNNL